jgi:hypothetical protein
MTSQEEQEIDTLFQREEFSKGHFLFQEGDICHHIFFLKKDLPAISITQAMAKK